MMKELMREVKDWTNEDEIAAYLEKITKKKQGDKSGWFMEWGRNAIYGLV